MRGPTRPALVTRGRGWRQAIAAALAALAFAAPAAWARRVAPDDGETQDRLDWERDQRKEIRELVQRLDLGRDATGRRSTTTPSGRDPDDDNPNRRLVRVTALAATASGDAIVGGTVRGPVKLGGTSVGPDVRDHAASSPASAGAARSG